MSKRNDITASGTASDRGKLRCPKCRSDIGAFFSIADLRAAIKRSERISRRSRIAIRAGQRRRAISRLMRIAMQEEYDLRGEVDTGRRERSVSIAGLAEFLVNFIEDETPSFDPEGDGTYEEYKRELTAKVKRKLIEYLDY